MTTLKFGSVEVTQVKELEEWRFPSNHLYPALTESAFGDAVTKWGSRLADPETHEVMLDINCFVVRTPESIIMVDTGNGNDKDRPALEAHHMFDTPFLENLAAAGVTPEQVDTVVSTHLHPDHCGWDTRLVDGEWVPTFSNAEHLFAKVELDYVSTYGRTAPEESAEHNFYKTWEDTIQPVLLAGLGRELTDSQTLFDDGTTRVWVEIVSGHTPGHLIVHIDAGDSYGILSGDAIHHPLQLADLDLPQVGDVDTAGAASVRRQLIKTCLDRDAILITAHFLGPGKVTEGSNGEIGFDWL